MIRTSTESVEVVVDTDLLDAAITITDDIEYLLATIHELRTRLASGPLDDEDRLDIAYELLDTIARVEAFGFTAFNGVAA